MGASGGGQNRKHHTFFTHTRPPLPSFSFACAKNTLLCCVLVRVCLGGGRARGQHTHAAFVSFFFTLPFHRAPSFFFSLFAPHQISICALLSHAATHAKQQEHTRRNVTKNGGGGSFAAVFAQPLPSASLLAHHRVRFFSRPRAPAVVPVLSTSRRRVTPHTQSQPHTWSQWRPPPCPRSPRRPPSRSPAACPPQQQASLSSMSQPWQPWRRACPRCACLRPNGGGGTW